ncbi:hypothetical protein WME79_49665 [Sorangium sp. So ce726]|uniref:hypothetical protein n=1 Tax=Sorangium sp. So ce726 TaxID=3133319 RepID=UPI003F5EC0E5
MLAFATVTSISGSAFAIRNDCYYEVSMKTGLRKVPVGKTVFQLAEQAGTLWNDECGYVGKWGVVAGPGAAVAANIFLRQQTTIGNNDCDWNSFYFTDGSISLLPTVPIPPNTVGFPPSSGITSRLQKAPLCNFVGMENDYNGYISATVQFYSALSMPVPVTFAPHCL